MIDQYFFELLQIAIGNRKELTSHLHDEEWASLYDMAKKQALLGIAFKGCEKLPTDQRPPMLLFIKWSGMAIKLKEKNEEISHKCVEVTEKFTKDGFNTCVLKGQGNLAYYPSDLGSYRTPGDIDVWLIPKECAYYPVRKIVDYVLQHTPEKDWDKSLSGMRQHHIDFPSISGTDVEVHFYPSYFNNPLHNKWFRKWSGNGRKWIEANAIVEGKQFPLPNPSFNAVYQLVHIYRHLFTEGIGLRQLLDYYFALKVFWDQGCAKDQAMDMLSSFGMRRFVGAVMYVLQTVFAMPEKYSLCSADPISGQFVLEEIMEAGNFGKYDERNITMKNASKVKRFYLLTKRNWRFLSLFPSEIVFDPIRRGWNVIWRRLKLWQFE